MKSMNFAKLFKKGGADEKGFEYFKELQKGGKSSNKEDYIQKSIFKKNKT